MLRIFYSDIFEMSLPAVHTFPLRKYRLLRERVEQLGVEELAVAVAATDEQLQLAHTPEYLEKVKQGRLDEMEIRRLGFPWSPELVERSRRSVGATIAAGFAALETGLGINLAGGTHHAFADAAEGYCVFNDSIVAARVLQRERGVGNVIVLDTDVHQGNGTASIATGDASIFTFSIHGAKNFPRVKVPGDLDVELPDETGDAEYLVALEQGATQALEAARAEVAIFLSGADPFAGDKLGRLSLSKAGLRQRDELVFALCDRYSLPVILTMGGGYAAEIEDTVEVYFNTVQTALNSRPKTGFHL